MQYGRNMRWITGWMMVGALSATPARAATINVPNGTDVNITSDTYWSPDTDTVQFSTHNGGTRIWVESVGADHIVDNPIIVTGSNFGGQYMGFDGSYNLTFNGNVQLDGAASGNVHQRAEGLRVDATPLITFTGDIGEINANAVLDKQGDGTLVLAGTASYTGETRISGGALRATDGVNIPAGTDIYLNGGVLETSGTFSRNLGHTGGDLTWGYSSYTSGSGGWAAYGGALTVDLDGAGANNLRWNVAGTLGPGYNNGGVWIMNSITANDVVTFVDNMDLSLGADNDDHRELRINDNSAVETDYVVISGVLSGSNAADTLEKTGEGRVDFTNLNTYEGPTVVSLGTLVAADNQAMGTATSGTTVSNNATLAFRGGVAYTAAEAVSIEGTGATGWSGAIDNLAGVNTFAGTVTLADDATIGSTAGRLTLQGGVDTAGSTVTFDGAGDLAIETSGVTGAGNVVKDGAGTLYLSGTHDWSGTTTVNDGSVKVNATTSGNGDWTVSNGGELGGTGTIGLLGGANSVTMTAGSTITPGFNSSSTIGDLTISGGDLVFDTGTVVYQWTFDASTNDVIAVNDLVFNAGSVVEIELYNNLADLQSTDSRVLFTYTGSVSGTPSFTYDPDNNPQGLNVYLVAPNVIDDGNGTLWLTGIRSVGVPEPSTLGMLLLGGLLIRRRMRRARRA